MNTDAAIPTNRQIYKVALASIVGSVIEQYDFLVPGVLAATIWEVFFSNFQVSPQSPRRSASTALASPFVQSDPNSGDDRSFRAGCLDAEYPDGGSR